MNKLIGVMALAIGVTLISCQDESDTIATTEIYVEDVNSAVTVDAMFEDVDDVADFGSESMSLSGAKLGEMRMGDTGRFSECASVTVDKTTSTVTVDFGDEGCEGRDGRVRKGKLHFTHTGERGAIGEKRVLTFEDYFVDSLGVEGTRTLENISEPEGAARIISITLVGGKIKFPDGTSITRDEDKTRTIAFNTDNEKFEAAVFGTAEGVNKDALAYVHSVSEVTPLLFTRECREIKRIAPVSGILLIQVEGESDKTIDFGVGTCDNLVTVTQDGISKEIEINPNERRRKHIRPKRM